MEVKVKTRKYVIQEGVESFIILPDKPTYYFQTGIRRSIACIPKWTNWLIKQHNKPEEIWEYDIIHVYLSLEARIIYSTIRISDLERLYNQPKGEMKDLLDFIISADEYCVRTREQFLKDYSEVIRKHKEILNIEE